MQYTLNLKDTNSEKIKRELDHLIEEGFHIDDTIEMEYDVLKEDTYGKYQGKARDCIIIYSKETANG